MAKKTLFLLPSLEKILKQMGENIRLARLRRRLSSSLIAERAGITRPTLLSIERGESTVSLGAYANVLMSLGLEKDLLAIAGQDELGLKLQDAGLLVKSRSPRRNKSKGVR
jgi:transcriptional regulator with XRE-family HTH domain